MQSLSTRPTLTLLPSRLDAVPLGRRAGDSAQRNVAAKSEPMLLEAYAFAILTPAGEVSHVRFGPDRPQRLRTAQDLSGLSAKEFMAGLFHAPQTVGKALEIWLLAGLAGEPTEGFRAELGTDEPILQAGLEPLKRGGFALSLEFGRPEADFHREAAAHALEDRLTGAGSRMQLERRLDAVFGEIESGETDSVLVMFLDLDRFKAVNDTLGHAVGDALLRLVAKRLQGGLRETDLLARMGGDEFAILLAAGGDPEQAAGLAQRLISLLQRPFLVEGQVVNIGASIGIACAPEHGGDRAAVLRRADLALYHAKSMGRGVAHFFEPVMEERAQQRRMLEQDLRRALLLRQFELHYQPQIDVEDSRVIGLEGLLRWRHPQRGLLMPGEFLAIAEEIGLGGAIGEWVIKTVCKDAKTWPESVTAAVNVSPQQFEADNFIGSVQRALVTAALPSHRLEIEVTERVLLCDPAKIRKNLDSLRGMGVKVAMDSFGTGVASLSQLVSFPFDKIKIDRSLVGGSGSTEKGRAILSAVSALGQSLGIATLAAGVETTEHLASVRGHGCQSVQGFYYSSAIPVKDLAALQLAPFNTQKNPIEATV